VEVAAVDMGPYQLLHSIKVTISRHLEDNVWGSRFPLLMNSSDTEARYGPGEVSKLLAELESIVEGLERLPPSLVERGSDSLPGEVPQQLRNPSALGLADYFLTVDGQSALRALLELCRLADAHRLAIAFT